MAFLTSQKQKTKNKKNQQFSTLMAFLELVHIIFAFEVTVELKPTDKQAVTGFSHFPETGRENQ